MSQKTNNIQKKGDNNNQKKNKNNKSQQSNKNNNSKTVFPPHVNKADIQVGLLSGKYVKGDIRINAKSTGTAYVTVAGIDRDVLVSGKTRQNRAFHGDIVVLELDPEDEWIPDDHGISKSKEGETEKELLHIPIAKEDGSNDLFGVWAEQDFTSTTNDNSIDNLTNNSSELLPKLTVRPTGKVVAIYESKSGFGEGKASIVGYVAAERAIQVNDRLRFVPLDARVAVHMINASQIPKDLRDDHVNLKTKLFHAQTLSWPDNSRNPSGKIISFLGESGDILVDSQALLVANGIDESDFSADVLADLPALPWSISEEEIAKRKDLRESRRIFSIDPKTAKDLDDALHIVPNGDGTFEVGVHIADVSHFVRPNTALDSEAADRATSTYLVQRVVPMLPHLLCEELCSLNPNIDRLAFSVIWKLSQKGEILSEWFGKTVIRSAGKLHYAQAQLVIEGKSQLEDDPIIPGDGHAVKDIIKDISLLWSIAKSLRASRFKNGALALNNIKLSFELDEDRNPVSTSPYIIKDANRMIEEYMLLANQAVAKKIYSTNPSNALLRRHEAPVKRKMDQFVAFCSKFGFRINPSTAGTLNHSFQAILRKYGVDVFDVLQNIATKPFLQAKYFSSGDFDSPEYFTHYALSMPFYTHFTSPIRRYADVCVHRTLATALAADPVPLPNSETLTRIADHCNDKKTAAKKAGDDSSKLFLAVLLREKGPIKTRGVVLDCNIHRFEVLVPDFGFDQRLEFGDYPSSVFEVIAWNAKTFTKTIKWTQSGFVQEIRPFEKCSAELRFKTGSTPLEFEIRLVHPEPELLPMIVAPRPIIDEETGLPNSRGSKKGGGSKGGTGGKMRKKKSDKAKGKEKREKKKKTEQEKAAAKVKAEKKLAKLREERDAKVAKVDSEAYTTPLDALIQRLEETELDSSDDDDNNSEEEEWESDDSYDEDKYTRCFNCDKLGHRSMDCPNELCFNCGKSGHRKVDCTEPRKETRACHRCGKSGHLARDCPNGNKGGSRGRGGQARLGRAPKRGGGRGGGGRGGGGRGGRGRGGGGRGGGGRGGGGRGGGGRGGGGRGGGGRGGRGRGGGGRGGGGRGNSKK